MVSSPSTTHVTGPHVELFSIAALPEPGTSRWGLARKAGVVAAVEGGLITKAEALARYDMSIDEYLSWRTLTIARGYPRLSWLNASAPLSKNAPEAQAS
jgi:hypothetical protein